MGRAFAHTSLKALQRDDVEVLIHHESELDSLPLLEKYRERVWCSCRCILDSNQTRDIEALDATQIPGNILDRRFTEYAHQRRLGAA